MSRILELILELKDRPESPWQDRLDRNNIWEDVKVLYNIQWSLKQSNITLAFIILAYDKKSPWLEIHKDRWENKRKIFTRLGGEINELTRKIIYNENEYVNQVVAWYYEYQKDWRWHSILTSFEYHAEMMRFAGFRTPEELHEEIITQENTAKQIKSIPISELAKGNKEKGANIQQGIEARQKGEKMLEEIRHEYMTLDAISEKEGKVKFTETYDPMCWATFLRSLKANEVQ